jgi:hypothetical protein
MRGRGVILGLLMGLAAMPGAAQVTEPGLRPQARPVAEATGDVAVRPRARPLVEAEAAPLRPRVRPGTAEAPDVPVAIAVDAAPETPVAPVPDAEATLPAVVGVPVAMPLSVTLDAPVVADAGPEGPGMEGPPQMVQAERLMSEPPAPPVFVDAWVGLVPEVRPGTDPAPDGVAAFLRPEARPEVLPVVDTALRVALRPRARPDAPDDPAPLVAAAPDAAPVFGLEVADAPQFSPLAVAVALRPPARNFRVVEQASAQPPPAPRGSLCGVAGLEGEVLAAIRGSGGCGVEEPVRLISVGGVRLSNAAVMDCGTATALLSWVQNSAQPRFNNTLSRIETMGSYDCRPRNNQAGARLSEHGKGRAIDIGGFVLTSGERITVLNDWGSRAWGEALRAMHRDACGTFGTVLGPNANRQHANHFHFDTAEHRNGAYCR